MPTHTDSGLARARGKFEPVARVLGRLAKDSVKQHGRTAVLEQRGSMEPMAQNAYRVRYSLRLSDDVRFGLTFVVTGEDSDLLLLECEERSGPPNPRANPGQVVQHVYRLEKIDEIKDAVQQQISAHLPNRDSHH